MVAMVFAFILIIPGIAKKIVQEKLIIVDNTYVKLV